jgi:hypothetical protein
MGDPATHEIEVAVVFDVKGSWRAARGCRPAGWSEGSVTKMVETYAGAVDDRRLDEVDRAFAERDAEVDPAAPRL